MRLKMKQIFTIHPPHFNSVTDMGLTSRSIDLNNHIMLTENFINITGNHSCMKLPPSPRENANVYFRGLVKDTTKMRSRTAYRYIVDKCNKKMGDLEAEIIEKRKAEEELEKGVVHARKQVRKKLKKKYQLSTRERKAKDFLDVTRNAVEAASLPLLNYQGRHNLLKESRTAAQKNKMLLDKVWITEIQRQIKLDKEEKAKELSLKRGRIKEQAEFLDTQCRVLQMERARKREEKEREREVAITDHAKWLDQQAKTTRENKERELQTKQELEQVLLQQRQVRDRQTANARRDEENRIAKVTEELEQHKTNRRLHRQKLFNTWKTHLQNTEITSPGKRELDKQREQHCACNPAAFAHDSSDVHKKELYRRLEVQNKQEIFGQSIKTAEREKKRKLLLLEEAAIKKVEQAALDDERSRKAAITKRNIEQRAVLESQLQQKAAAASLQILHNTEQEQLIKDHQTEIHRKQLDLDRKKAIKHVDHVATQELLVKLKKYNAARGIQIKIK